MAKEESVREVCNQRFVSIEKDVECVKIKVDKMDHSISNLHTKFAVLDTKVAMYTGVAAFIASIIGAIVVRIFNIG